MKNYFIHTFLFIFAFALCSCVSAQTPQPEDTRPLAENAKSPSPTPTPCDPVMPKEKQPTAAPAQSSGPISGQAAASGTSAAVRDLPPPKPGTPQPPREINPLNTEPVKGIKPVVTPCSETALTNATTVQNTPKKKPVRKRKSKTVKP